VWRPMLLPRAGLRTANHSLARVESKNLKELVAAGGKTWSGRIRRRFGGGRSDGGDTGNFGIVNSRGPCKAGSAQAPKPDGMTVADEEFYCGHACQQRCGPPL
jgi:hypothetical protein